MRNDGELSGPRVEWGLVIHGGVGVLPPQELTPELEAAYRQTLTDSLSEGFRAMSRGGTAVDGVVEAIKVMEDSVLFNAGRGSNLTSEGVVSMDASLMVGDTLAAGAVAGVGEARNPIRLARHVMEDCPHVMLAGSGADAFAREVGLEVEEPSYFFTQRRWDEMQAAKAREAEGEARPNTVDMEQAQALAAGAEPPTEEDLRHRSGTVGAVALDRKGLLVAGTSTGGSANKKWGRIGDSPVVGAGTYAGSHCGVSCTGWGEYFIRHAVAHDIQARMAYLGLSLRAAAHQVVMEKLEEHRKGLGGVVAMDREGHVEMCFNTRGMYRGWVDEDGRIQVAIF
ncbi:MAG: isoaspartyl peptidase/L-asparaginase [Longimicrobiales bacterium]|nr:isoaspartyl peptidase/L-asparaginase [Longimicrobiales bacterium]